MSSNCPCSKSHFDHLNQLSKKNPDVLFVGFQSDKNEKLAKSIQYYSKFKIDFPIIDDTNLVWANKFNALKTPHVFVFDQNGKTLYQGAVSSSRNPVNAKSFYLQNALEKLKNNQKPEPSLTRALGCYIQR